MGLVCYIRPDTVSSDNTNDDLVKVLVINEALIFMRSIRPS